MEDNKVNLITTQNNKPVTTSLVVAEYFSKNTYDINKSIRNLLADAPELSSEFMKDTYKDSRNRMKNLWYMTQKGFSILCMGFSGKKALQWKIKFYDQFEQMRAELKMNAKLHTLHAIDSNLNRLQESNETLLLESQQMRAELEAHRKYLQLLTDKSNTVCISDIVAIFQKLTAYEANQILIDAGVIVRRSSGIYPTDDFKESDLVVSCKAENMGYLYNYVRYTPKGEEYVMQLLTDMGYKLTN